MREKKGDDYKFTWERKETEIKECSILLHCLDLKEYNRHTHKKKKSWWILQFISLPLVYKENKVGVLKGISATDPYSLVVYAVDIYLLQGCLFYFLYLFVCWLCFSGSCFFNCEQNWSVEEKRNAKFSRNPNTLYKRNHLHDEFIFALIIQFEQKKNYTMFYICCCLREENKLHYLVMNILIFI